MSALIRCVLHLDIEVMGEDEIHKAWGQVKYYLKVTHSVEFI